MPELPDVEVFRRYLEENAQDAHIRGVHVSNEKILKNVGSRTLQRRLKNAHLGKTRRHGKTLFAALNGKGWLVFHFGMDGRLRTYRSEEERPRHERVRFDLEDGRHLAYESTRMLGEVNVAPEAEKWIEEHDLGPDALDVDPETFVRVLGSRQTAIKPTLMNQALLAGVGNVYADEILFQAGIHPLTPAKKLDEKDLKRLYKTMRKVLQQSIERGADPSRMPKTWLLPNREEGKSCPRCSGSVEKIKVGGRSSYLCPSCQQRR